MQLVTFLHKLLSDFMSGYWGYFHKGFMILKITTVILIYDKQAFIYIEEVCVYRKK
jgi:hypothetical protein